MYTKICISESCACSSESHPSCVCKTFQMLHWEKVSQNLSTVYKIDGTCSAHQVRFPDVLTQW